MSLLCQQVIKDVLATVCVFPDCLLPGLVTHADHSRVSKAFSCVCDSVCLSLHTNDKTKTAKTKITRLGTRIVHHESSPTNWPNIRSKSQRSRSEDHKVEKGDRVAGMRYALYRMPSLYTCSLVFTARSYA